MPGILKADGSGTDGATGCVVEAVSKEGAVGMVGEGEVIGSVDGAGVVETGGSGVVGIGGVSGGVAS